MTRPELAKVYAMIKTLWRNYLLPEAEADAEIHDAVWFDYLEPYTLNQIGVALKQYAKTSEFCNIGKIAALLEDLYLQSDDNLTEVDIANEIDKAISYYNASENFESLSPIAKRIVGQSSQLRNWAQCDIQEFETVIKSNIMRTARELLSKEKKKKSVQMLTGNNISLLDLKD